MHFLWVVISHNIPPPFYADNAKSIQKNILMIKDRQKKWGLKKFSILYRMREIFYREGEVRMKLCFCRFLLAAAIVVIAVFFLDQSWAKLVLIIAGALLAIMSLFYQKCLCAGKEKPVEKPAE
jgi:hypothetical protein